MKFTASNKSILILLVLLIAAITISASAQQKDWKEETYDKIPRGRDDHMMAFNSWTGETIMYGGDNSDAITWFWDGERWKDYDVTSPGGRREAAMAFNTKRNYLVLFGGNDFTTDTAVTWIFKSNDWDGFIQGSGPAERSDFAACYADHMDKILIYGGDGLDGSVWGFDYGDWDVLAVETEDGPGQRWGHKMVYDQEREVVVMFGGVQNNLLQNDIWEFDGEEWTEVTPAEGETAPSARRDFVMVYDSRQKLVLVFGGRDSEPEGFNDLWAWDGDSWHKIKAGNKPSVRHESMGVFDVWRNKLIIFGGSSGFLEDDRYKDDTWTWPHKLPEIEHTPETLGVKKGTDLTISATVTGFKSNDTEVRLFYKKTSNKTFKSTRMEEQEDGSWLATIEGEYYGSKDFEYYIGAIDRGKSDEWNYWRNDLNPQLVTVGDTGRLKVIMVPGDARADGARWRIEGMDTWKKSGQVIDKLQPGIVKIEFLNIEGYYEPSDIEVEIIRGRKTEHIGLFVERTDGE